MNKWIFILATNLGLKYDENLGNIVPLFLIKLRVEHPSSFHFLYNQSDFQILISN